ncbi:hypothetical protein SAMN05216207_105133 [Pseudonocardia ammonioxydans]|uniref:Abi-like protein n=1 Tax=Pseudonocardia ammonioxydans TaxID=260086 RepID=A0A1I5GVE4_PSUAM|nr:hypothetical protein SAMN05216207_105133 [Pseudonocardia ammonioxydans]
MSNSSVATAALVEQAISPSRLGPYRAAVGGDLQRAVQLYRWNATVSASFWEVLGHGEVFLRNAINNALVTAHHRHAAAGDWFDDPRGVLTARARADIDEARRRTGTSAPAGKVVAELNFGFWRFLLARRYTSTLWPAIRHAFPHLPRGRRNPQVIEEPVIRLHTLRNRIAHHEPLLSIPLHDRVDDLRFVLDAIDPRLRTWAVDDDTRLLGLLTHRP